MNSLLATSSTRALRFSRSDWVGRPRGGLFGDGITTLDQVETGAGWAPGLRNVPRLDQALAPFAAVRQLVAGPADDRQKTKPRKVVAGSPRIYGLPVGQ